MDESRAARLALLTSAAAFAASQREKCRNNGSGSKSKLFRHQGHEAHHGHKRLLGQQEEEEKEAPQHKLPERNGRVHFEGVFSSQAEKAIANRHLRGDSRSLSGPRGWGSRPAELSFAYASARDGGSPHRPWSGSSRRTPEFRRHTANIPGDGQRVRVYFPSRAPHSHRPGKVEVCEGHIQRVRFTDYLGAARGFLEHCNCFRFSLEDIANWLDFILVAGGLVDLTLQLARTKVSVANGRSREAPTKDIGSLRCSRRSGHGAFSAALGRAHSCIEAPYISGEVSDCIPLPVLQKEVKQGKLSAAEAGIAITNVKCSKNNGHGFWE